MPFDSETCNLFATSHCLLATSLEGLMLRLKLQYFGHLIGKDLDAGRDWEQEEKGTTEDEMAGWHH